MTPNICRRQRESQIKRHGNPESEWLQHACLMTFRGSAARVEPPSGTSYMPDGGGGRIVIGLVQAGPF
jgi:hypothetical protein